MSKYNCSLSTPTLMLMTLLFTYLQLAACRPTTRTPTGAAHVAAGAALSAALRRATGGGNDGSRKTHGEPANSAAATARRPETNAVTDFGYTADNGRSDVVEPAQTSRQTHKKNKLVELFSMVDSNSKQNTAGRRVGDGAAMSESFARGRLHERRPRAVIVPYQNDPEIVEISPDMKAFVDQYFNWRHSNGYGRLYRRWGRR